jgi:DNA-binding transcriptional ArsR family regulator
MALSEVGACADGRLIDELAAILEPALRDALNHPTRRDILRVLNAQEEGLGIDGILGKVPPLKRGEVDYHLQVLLDRGAVVEDGTRPALGGREPTCRPAFADDAKVRAALRVTEREDRRRREGAGNGGSSGLLTMFRVPRPERTIHLGNLFGRKRDPEK